MFTLILSILVLGAYSAAKDTKADNEESKAKQDQG